MHHFISEINSLTHFVNHVLICLFLTRHTSMISSPYQCYHHHFCHPSPCHSFILISKLLFFSNSMFHRHLAPPRTDSTAIWTCSRFDFLLFQFFLSFSFHYFFIFLSFYFFILVLFYFNHFPDFLKFYI